jgi:acyl-CoA thioesterase II
MNKDQPRPIFGGFFVAQAISAATLTVPPGFAAHSAQTVFLRPGNPTQDITYRVERVLDGRSMATRLVCAEQDSICAFHATICFQRVEENKTPSSSTSSDLVYDTPLHDWAQKLSPEDPRHGNNLSFMHELGLRAVDMGPAHPEPVDWRHVTWDHADAC